jgi:hypothetical protein
MKDPDQNDRNADSSEQNTLNLENYLAAYVGLEISERCSNASYEEITETILIAEWVRPDWSEKPLLKLDYPQMGYVSYLEAPPP